MDDEKPLDQLRSSLRRDEVDLIAAGEAPSDEERAQLTYRALKSRWVAAEHAEKLFLDRERMRVRLVDEATEETRRVMDVWSREVFEEMGFRDMPLTAVRPDKPEVDYGLPFRSVDYTKWSAPVVPDLVFSLTPSPEYSPSHRDGEARRQEEMSGIAVRDEAFAYIDPAEVVAIKPNTFALSGRVDAEIKLKNGNVVYSKDTFADLMAKLAAGDNPNSSYAAGYMKSAGTPPGAVSEDMGTLRWDVRTLFNLLIGVAPHGMPSVATPAGFMSFRWSPGLDEMMVDMPSGARAIVIKKPL